MDRRSFLRQGSLATAALGLSPSLGASAAGNRIARTYKISLKQDAIGVNLGLEALLAAAERIGFEAVAVPSEWLLDKSKESLKELNEEVRARGLSYGSAGVPVQFRADLERFERDLAALPAHARAMQAAGITRVGTWVMPSHAERAYEENFALHAKRLRRCASIYADHGIRLGLEYVGTKTLHDQAEYGFIRTGRQLKTLIEAIDVPGLGVVLDSFHWYTSGETADHLSIWRNEDIVAVDLNDADAGLSRLAQLDGNRELPGATGKIDLAAFVGFLRSVNYDGPIRAEPFNATLNAMRDELAMQATYEAMAAAIK